MDHAVLARFPGPVERPAEAEVGTRDLFSLVHAELLDHYDAVLVRSNVTDGRAPTEEVIERIGQMFEIANSRFFHVDLFHPIDLEVVGIAHVHHQDLLPGPEIGQTTRKLAMAIALDVGTPDGRSEARFAHVPKRVEIGVGTAVVYPAFAPVTFQLGHEQSVDTLIAFAHGPRFR